MAKKIKVLVIDDSPLIRGILTEVLNADPQIEVVDTAEDPFVAREKIKQLNPDVLTLDIEMPKMNGIAFLKNLMRLRPMPVIMVSTLTEQGAPITFEALSLGAVDFVAKPKTNVIEAFNLYSQDLIDKVKAAYQAKPQLILHQQTVSKPVSVCSSKTKFDPNYIIAIGASTGGTEAIKEVVRSLPDTMCPIVVAQHIPPVFSTSYAQRLNSLSNMTVYEAQHGQAIEQGCIYIAPGDDHLTIKRTSSGYICQLDKGELVNRHRPAVDKLFDSVAEQSKGKCTGVILTGMGSDGAKGLLNMKNAGCKTIAQDEATSIVWGMPCKAVELGAAHKILPLQEIANVIMKTAIKR